jgi:hypothetical protein
MYKQYGLSNEVKAFVGNVAEGYSFPTNLDRRVPEVAGMAPASEQDLTSIPTWRDTLCSETLFNPDLRRRATQNQARRTSFYTDRSSSV